LRGPSQLKNVACHKQIRRKQNPHRRRFYDMGGERGRQENVGSIGTILYKTVDETLQIWKRIGVLRPWI
jgi:hypothetical protein